MSMQHHFHSVQDVKQNYLTDAERGPRPEKDDMRHQPQGDPGAYCSWYVNAACNNTRVYTHAEDMNECEFSI